MMSIELAYDIAQEMELDSSEFVMLLDDCNNDRIGEWEDQILDCCSKELVDKFYEAIGKSEKRVYQISVDIEADEDFEPYEVVEYLRDEYLVLGWNQETSWSVREYRNGVN